MGHSASGEIWTSMSKMEGTDAKTYLNDLQHSIAHASPGHLAIIDAGEAAKWGRAIPGYPSRTSGVSPYGGPLGETTESIIGKQSENVGKNTLDTTHSSSCNAATLGFGMSDKPRKHRIKLEDNGMVPRCTICFPSISHIRIIADN